MSKNSGFPKGISPLFLSKNRNLYDFCFLGKSSHKKLFFKILDKKECFFRPEKGNFQKV